MLELDGISGTVVLDLEPLYLGGVEYSGNVVMPTMQFLPTMTGNGIYQLFMVMTGGWFMIVLTTLSIHIYIHNIAPLMYGYIFHDIFQMRVFAENLK